jgi:hypothetical protein
MIPWLVELLPPILLTLLGCAFSLLAFAPMLVPVYMVERITGLSVNTRSVDLLTRGWAKSLLPLLLVAGVLGAVLVAGTVSLHSIPVVGVWAAALFGPMWLALTLPFILFLQFHAYADTRWRVEGVDVAELIRSEA